MSDPKPIKKGDRRTYLGFEWAWVNPDGAIRGHWQATDGTGIAVFPPSPGHTEWEVTEPAGGSESLARMGTASEAFVFASARRKPHAN